MAAVYLVQHAEKQKEPGDPGLTEHGREQASRTGQWLRGVGLAAVYGSPQRRAWQTAELIAAATGLLPKEDERLRERMNWDGDQSLDDFLADWAHSARDRDFVPHAGESARQAGERLLAFVLDVAERPAPVAAVTHGGVTVELLRSLVGDESLPPGLLDEGVPSCALTVLQGLTVISVASTAHLR